MTWRAYRTITGQLKVDKIECYTCGKPIEIGDKVVRTVSGGSRTKVRYRHKKCYDNLFI